MAQTVTLQPGESRVVSFEFTPDVGDKVYGVRVDGLYGTFYSKGIPTPITRPLELRELSVSPSTVTEGQRVTVHFDLLNIGGEDFPLRVQIFDRNPYGGETRILNTTRTMRAGTAFAGDIGVTAKTKGSHTIILVARNELTGYGVTGRAYFSVI